MTKPILALAVLLASLPAVCAELPSAAPKTLAQVTSYWPLYSGGAYALVSPSADRQIGLSLTEGQKIEAIVRTSPAEGAKLSGTIVKTWPLRGGDVSMHVETEPGKVMATAMSQIHAIAVQASGSEPKSDVFDNGLRVGDRVLDVAGGTGYQARVKELHSDGSVRVGYGWLSGLADTYRPASHLIKQVKTVGGFRVGDKVVNPINGTGYKGRIKKLN